MLLYSREHPVVRPASRTISLLFFLLFITGCANPHSSGEADLLPEDNLRLLLSGLKPGQPRDAQADWIRQIVAESDPHFTDRCQAFVDEMYEAYWGYPEDGEAGDREAFENKWQGIYDLEHAWFGHMFEEGNCGWTVKTLESLNYVGSGIGGDWYRLTVRGGCSEDNSNSSVGRILKLVENQGSWAIDAVYSTELL